MKMVLVESQYFGCIKYHEVLFNNKRCMIDRQEVFRKMSFRNRCIIIGSNGPINLSIPVAGGRNNKRPMKEVRICYFENWQQQHWKAIVSSYAKAPFFEYYKTEAENLIKTRHDFLIDKNMAILLWLKGLLNMPVEILFNEVPDTDFENGDLEDYRNRWLPNNYLKSDGHIAYSQVFEDKLGFHGNASILDIIFCEGPNAKNCLIK